MNGGPLLGPGRGGGDHWVRGLGQMVLHTPVLWAALLVLQYVNHCFNYYMYIVQLYEIFSYSNLTVYYKNVHVVLF